MSTALSVSSPAIDEQDQTAAETVFRNLLGEILPFLGKFSDRLNCALTCQYGFAMAVPELYKSSTSGTIECVWASGCDLVSPDMRLYET
jgi:hypothetical protein